MIPVLDGVYMKLDDITFGESPYVCEKMLSPVVSAILRDVIPPPSSTSASTKTLIDFPTSSVYGLTLGKDITQGFSSETSISSKASSLVSKVVFWFSNS